MVNRPTGTVTLLFAAIEGSTSLWENYPKHMQSALARYYQILQGAVEPGGGYVFETVGDAWRAAFRSAPNALRAALEAQRAFCAERWSEPIDPLLVRMALHTGFVEERDGAYFGAALDRVGRLLRTGHGGQILVSGATHGLVSDQLREVDPQAELVELGEYRLGDLTHPEEHVYRLAAPDLPDEFPPLRAGGAGERYRIKDYLGGGGMALVFLAHDEELDQEVAYKRLLPRYAQDEEFVERFRREARSAAKLRSHPNIVPIYDRGRTAQGTYYLVMEYVPGGTLKDLIEKEGPLPVSEAIRLTIQVAQALREAHERGIIHRDVKPQNVLLTEKGEAKLADFGIARAASSMTMTTTSQVAPYTPAYASPEQKNGHRVDGRSDLYCLGVVLHEMLTGESPFETEREAPEELRGIILRLLAEEPEERYQDAAALIGDLEAITKDLEAKTRGPVRVTVGAGRRRSWPWSAAVGLAAAAKRFGGLGSRLWRRSASRGVVRENRHSRMGIASLVLPLLTGGIPFFYLFVVAELAVSVPPWSPLAQVLGLLVIGSLLLNLFSLGLGIAGIRQRRRKRLFAILGTVFSSLVIVGWSVLLLLGTQDGANTQQNSGAEAEMLPVPDLVGLTEDEAERRVGEDFEITYSSEISGEPRGTIFNQSPEAGERRSRGSRMYVTVSAGEPQNPGDIFEDNFSDNAFSDTAGGWNTGEDAEGNVAEYASGRLRLYQPPSTEFGSSSFASGVGSIGDSIVEVDATRIADAPGEADVSSWGVLCRTQVSGAGYFLLITDSSSAQIVKYDESGGVTVLAEGLFSEAISQGSEANHIRADCVGSELALYVNGQKLLEAEDADFGIGEVGLFVSSFAEEGPGADRLFDNFQVSTPP